MAYGRTDRRRLPLPAGPPAIASAFGNTDGETFGRILFRPKIFRSKIFRPKFFRSKIFPAEKFAVRIAEGGNYGGGPGGAEAPPGPSYGRPTDGEIQRPLHTSTVTRRYFYLPAFCFARTGMSSGSGQDPTLMVD